MTNLFKVTLLSAKQVTLGKCELLNLWTFGQFKHNIPSTQQKRAQWKISTFKFSTENTFDHFWKLKVWLRYCNNVFVVYMFKFTLLSLIYKNKLVFKYRKKKIWMNLNDCLRLFSSIHLHCSSNVILYNNKKKANRQHRNSYLQWSSRVLIFFPSGFPIYIRILVPHHSSFLSAFKI